MTGQCSPEVGAVLAGRDERRSAQIGLLYGEICDGLPDRFLCQVSLNIPGYPKRLLHDEDALHKGVLFFLRRYGRPPMLEKLLLNGAGACWLGLFDGYPDAIYAKRAAVAAEEENPACRIFDIDIITLHGQISRSSLGFPQRRCILCDAEAKECARSNAHSTEELRSVCAALLHMCASNALTEGGQK